MKSQLVQDQYSSGLPDEGYLRIGEVAERIGLTQRTIRYYEELGLLPPPTRTQGDFRLFSAADVDRLQQIVRLKSLMGFSLTEIREVVDAEATIDQLRNEYRATGDTALRLSKLDEALELTRSQLQLLKRKLGQMNELKSDLEERATRYVRKRRELLSTHSDIDDGDRAPEEFGGSETGRAAGGSSRIGEEKNASGVASSGRQR